MTFPPPSPKQARLIWTAVTAFAAGVLVGLVGLLIWGLGKVLQLLGPVLWPLAIAGIIACLLDPVVDFLERKRVSSRRAIVLVFAVGLGLVLSLMSLIVPRLILETRQLISDMPRYTQELQSNLNKWIDSVRQRTSILKSWKFFSPPTEATNTASPVVQPTLAAASAQSNEGATNLVVAPVRPSPEREWETEITHYFFSWLKDAMP